MSETLQAPPFTNLQLVERVDSWPYFIKDPDAYRRHMQDYYYFFIDGYDKPFGYVHKRFISDIPWPESWKIDLDKHFLTLTTGFNFATRSQLMKETLRRAHESPDGTVIGRWADEEFPLYSSTGEHVLDLAPRKSR